MPTTRTTIGRQGQTVIISLGPEVDQQCWEYRQAGFTWQTVANMVGLGGASSARTAASRHARNLGMNTGYVPQNRRASGVRTYGVEIEFVNLTRLDACLAIEQALGIPHVHLMDYHGRECYRCQQRIRGYREWKVERDGSVSNGDWGGEVVTPILQGDDGFEAIRKVMRALRQANAEVDATCGMHVHLSVEHMNNGQRSNLVRKWYEHHDTIDRFVAKSRTMRGQGRGYDYCRREDDNVWQDQARRMERLGNFGYTDKYRSLNLTPFAKYGTVEVRMHQGTLNSQKAKNWIKFLIGFLDAVEKEESDSLASGLALLGSLADANKISQETAAYLMARAEQLA